MATAVLSNPNPTVYVSLASSPNGITGDVYGISRAIYLLYSFNVFLLFVYIDIIKDIKVSIIKLCVNKYDWSRIQNILIP